MSPTHDIDIHRNSKAVAPTHQRKANSSVRVPQSLSSITSHPYYPHNLRRCTCPQFFALRTLPPGNNNVYGVTACIPQQ